MEWIVGMGMLGKELADSFKKENIPFVGTNSDVDITNLEVLKEYVKDKNISTIINCAAYTNVDKAETDINAYLVNSLGAYNLALIANELDIPIIHISTDYVFDGEQPSPSLCKEDVNPYTESDKTNPINAYGKSKLYGEIFISKACKKFFILRTSWLYGKYRNNFVDTMLNLMKEKDTISVISNRFGNPTWTVDVCDIIVSLIKMNTDDYGIYHCSDTGFTNRYDFACEIQKIGLKYGILNKSIEIKSVLDSDFPSNVKRPKNSILSSDGLLYTFWLITPYWYESLDNYIKSLSEADTLYHWAEKAKIGGCNRYVQVPEKFITKGLFSIARELPPSNDDAEALFEFDHLVGAANDS